MVLYYLQLKSLSSRDVSWLNFDKPAKRLLGTFGSPCWLTHRQRGHWIFSLQLCQIAAACLMWGPCLVLGAGGHADPWATPTSCIAASGWGWNIRLSQELPKWFLSIFSFRGTFHMFHHSFGHSINVYWVLFGVYTLKLFLPLGSKKGGRIRSSCLGIPGQLKSHQ